MSSTPTEDQAERPEEKEDQVVLSDAKVIRNVAFVLNRNTGKAKIVTMFEIHGDSSATDELTDAMVRYIGGR